MAEWVGIDGFDNGDLIQAGVSLDPDPSNPSRAFSVTPWWEILPAPETPISTMTVNVGDSVSVDIEQDSSSNFLWDINLVDNTNGQSFTTQQAYAGPGDTAEWIVEAPTILTSNGDEQTSIAPFSPAVLFSNLEVSENAPDADARLVLIDNTTHKQTATPSNLDANGFRVAYGPNIPPEP